MHAHARRRGTQLVDGERHVEQGRDVGHANQAQADAFTTGGVGGVVVRLLVQLPGLLQHQVGKVRASLVFAHAGPVGGQGRNAGPAAYIGLLQARQAFLHVGAVRVAKISAPGAVLRGLVKLVYPQAADIDRLAGALAAVLLEHATPGAVGHKQPLHQGRRQGG
jgi:hypothetical protein